MYARLQVQEGNTDELKKMAEEVQATKHMMKKAQLHAEEVQGTFDTHNGEYVRMKVRFCNSLSIERQIWLFQPAYWQIHPWDVMLLYISVLGDTDRKDCMCTKYALKQHLDRVICRQACCLCLQFDKVKTEHNVSIAA